MINSVGIVGAMISPLMIGLLKDLTNSFVPGLLAVTVVLAVAVICILLISKQCIELCMKQRKPVTMERPS